MTASGVPSGLLTRAALARAWKGKWTLVASPGPPPALATLTTEVNCVGVYLFLPRDTDFYFTTDPANPPVATTAFGGYIGCKSGAAPASQPIWIPVIGGTVFKFSCAAILNDDSITVFQVLDEAAV